MECARTVMPSASQPWPTLQSPKLESRLACTAAALVDAGTAMAAVMITLPAVTEIVTMLAASAALTVRPAAWAILCDKPDVSG